MSPMKWFYAAFWIFVGVALFWQFSVYNAHIDKVVAAAGPRQQHFYFNNQTKNTTTLTPPKADGAEVKQVNFTVEAAKPTAQEFTCHVTLKNVGNRKAINVRVMVSPFRGIALGSQDGGRNDALHTLSDSDPAALINQWVEFPEMAPGQTLTKDVVFSNNNSYDPGSNYDPQINFETAKP